MEERVFRVLDAAGNRAVEGLRTAEDYARFIVDDALLTDRLKNLRHRVAAALQQLPSARLLGSRDSVGDVGLQAVCESANQRSSTRAVAEAALQRAIEALRTLEEFGKLVDPAFAAEIEQARYAAYQLSSVVRLLENRAARLECVQLYLLIDAQASESALAACITALAEAGVDCFQLRDKTASDEVLYRRACAGREAAHAAGALWIVNDRVDIALASGADGVHVGQDELPVAAVRKVAGNRLMVGVSTHDADQLERAVLDGADYVGCGPVFPSGTKRFSEFVGTEYVRHAIESTRLPAFAIGGITPENVAEVIAVGCSRVALAGGILGSDDPVAETQRIKALLLDAGKASGNP